MISLFASSCKKDTPVTEEEDPIIESVNDLVVPADFDWKTTKTINVNINLPSSGEIQPLIITDREGTIRYFRGYPENGSRTINTLITIPSYVNELKLTYNGAVGPNIVYVSNEYLDFNYNNIVKSTETVNCDLDGFATYSKGGWGQKAAGNNVGSIRDAHFDEVYNNGSLVVGVSPNYTLTFESSSKVKNYLPGGGQPKILSNSWVNPKKKDKLGNMADQITAARLNRDFDFAGKIGSNVDYTLGELVFADGPFENMTVNDFLLEAENALGGGGLNGNSASDYSTAAEAICMSFHEGTDNTGALTCPADPEVDDPFIEVSSICSGTDVIFTIKNIGDGNMIGNEDYTVYKNDIEIDNGQYQLNVNQTLDITATGFDNDEFKVVVETPRGLTLTEIRTGCGEDEGGGNNPNPPSEQLTGTLAYEDLWPGKGDYDFNDLVVDYDFAIAKDDQEYVQTITATFTIKAFGASLHNGFGFTFPTVLPSDITSVTGYDVINNTVFSMASNGLENGQSKATVIVFDDVRRVMPQTTGGIGVNTQLEYDYHEPVSIVVEITFADEAVTYSELNIGSFNPFLIVNTISNNVPGERGLEIHLPYYAPSDLFDESYFGQSEDDSSVGTGRYFVTSDNLPWAINIAEEFDWVIEFQDITGAYTHFAEWAQSGGDNYADWYKDFSGYRNNSLIYPTQIGK